MNQDSTYMVVASKVPMLKPENGNAPPITKVVKGVETTIAPARAEEKAQRRLDLKTRSTLLMGIPNEHQLKFNFIKDAKSLLQAIEKKNGTHIPLWRNKPKIDTLSLDDLYNNLKIYKPEVKGTSSSNTNRQNKAFVSSNSNNSINGAVNTTHVNQTAYNLTMRTCNKFYLDDLEEMDLRWRMAMLTIRARRFLKNIGRKFSMNGNDTIRFDKSKMECYNFHKRGHFARECTLRNQENKNRESTRRNVLVETPDSLALVSCDGLEGYDWSDQAKEEFVNEPIVSEPTVKKPVVEIGEAKASADKPKVVRKNFDSPLIEDWISDSKDEDDSKHKIEKKNVKPSVAKIEFLKAKEQVKSFRKTTVKQVLVNTARQVSTAHPKSTVNVARPLSHLLKSAYSSVKRPFDKKTTLTNSNVTQKVNTIRSKYVNTSRPKVVVNVVLGNKVNVVKGNPQQDFQDKRVTGNMSYLTDYKEINGGYVAFGGNPKGGKITRRVPRKNNMYSVDLKNIVLKGDLTCLFAKAISDESKLWHRRLGHLNFKTMNKLVKGNLVRAERRNMTLIKAARTMLADSNYQLLFGQRTPALSFMRPFRCPVTILNTKDHLGTKACDDAGKARMETVPCIDYILLSLWTVDPLISQKSKSSQDDGFQPLSDGGKKVNESECKDQEKEDNVNNTNNVNDAGINRVNDEDDDTVADMNNLDTTIQVSPVPTTRIHKDHPIDQVIGDLHLITQIRNISKNLEEHGFVTTIHKRTNHKDLQNYLFVYFLSQEEPKRGKIDKTLFIRRYKDDILFVQVYVDDIIFGLTKKDLCNAFEKMMHEKFQMSSIGDLTFFLGLQVKEKQDGIFISQDKCVAEILKKYRYLKGHLKLGLWYPKDSPFNLVAYTDSDYAGTSLDRKTTTRRWFEQIVDCLNANPIKYALTVNPIVYTSCIVQLWATVKVKTINGEVQLQALVDGKKVIITEFTIRRDLRLEYADGVDYLPNVVIFEQLTLMGISAKTTTWNEFSSTMASVIICLATNQKFNFSKYIFESMVKNLDNVNKFLMYPRKTKRKDTELPQTSVPTSVADEVVNEEMDDSLERAATTATSLDVKQERELKHAKPKIKAKGIVFHEPEESTTTTTTAIPKPKSHVKAKGQAKMIKEPKMFNRAFKRVNTFVDHRTELVEKSSKKVEAEVIKGSFKRATTELEQESSKKQKIDDDKDTAELK
uniref:Copia protein n=1 Tax=Tanacetum cinerariifolium TaxID=118510 RepID=A0A699HGN8_TANCI|nr:copia protein [Tanacetum cinerariifolium]